MINKKILLTIAVICLSAALKIAYLLLEGLHMI
jgi:hypothetical protein